MLAAGVVEGFFIQGNARSSHRTHARRHTRCSPGYSSTTASTQLSHWRIPNTSQGARFTDSEVHHRRRRIRHCVFDSAAKSFITCEVAIINNLEFDHADIFDNLEAIKLPSNILSVIPRNAAPGERRRSHLAPLLNVTHWPGQTFLAGEANAGPGFQHPLRPTATESRFPASSSTPTSSANSMCATRCGGRRGQTLRPQEPADSSGIRYLKGIKRRMEVAALRAGSLCG